MKHTPSVVMLGATGAVGNHAARTLAAMPQVSRLSLLGRRPADNVVGPAVSQASIDVLAPASYRALLAGHRTAVCTLGVGQPSKMSKEEFVRVDHDAVLGFATACKEAGVNHFELLSSVAANASSSSFYLRTKGQLEGALMGLGFDRLSLFHPSMIITPTNRYGIVQAIALAVMPLIDPLLMGPLRKYRGIDVGRLGRAIAANVLTGGHGLETLHWDDFMALCNPPAVLNALRGE